MEKSLIIISPYPPKNTTYENKYSALASFCKNTVSALQKTSPNIKILVLADIIPNAYSWQEKNLKVKRVWKRNSFKAYFSLLKAILKEKKTSKVLIELEWALFGKSPVILSLMPLFIMFLRLFSKKVFVIPHGVALNFLSLAPSIGLSKSNIKAKLYSFFLNLFYAGLIFSASKIIVLEQYFSNLINKKFKTRKAVFIPHGVDVSLNKIPKELAKSKLRINPKTFLIVNFGFLNWYKGSDIIAKLFLNYVQKNPTQNVQLIFAGGTSFIHKKEKAYKQFIKSIEDIEKQTDKIKITGFLPEEKLCLYFSAADAFIFPYRLFISSSGPLSFAFSFKKPILLSEKLNGYFKSIDMQKALENSGLRIADITFNNNNFNQQIQNLMRKENLEKSVKFSSSMESKRSWNNIGKLYLKVLYEEAS